MIILVNLLFLLVILFSVLLNSSNQTKTIVIKYNSALEPLLFYFFCHLDGDLPVYLLNIFEKYA